MYFYVNPRAASGKWDAYQVFQSEWFYSEYRMPIEYDEYNIEASASYQDMLLWHGRKMLRAGMDGLYYDNVRVRTTFDPVRGPAYELPNGKIQPYFDFFSFRELLKRTATMVYLEGKNFLDGRPLMILHMTNGALVPFLSFSAMQLDLESEYGPREFHDRFSEGYYLTETIGTQTGNIPHILNCITGNNRQWIARTFLSVQLAMDLPLVLWQNNPDPVVNRIWKKLHDFGYGLPDVAVYPSWDKKHNPAFSPADNVRISSYVWNDCREAMAAVCEFGGKTGEVTADFSKLNFGDIEVADTESGQFFPAVNGKITLKLQRHDFRLLRIKKSLMPKPE